jgi:tetratricopeptide (TPR) repeat protein
MRLCLPLLFLTTFLPMLLLAQGAAEKPLPPGVLDPISRRQDPPVPASPPGGELLLPEDPGSAVDAAGYENPLLLFQQSGKPLPLVADPGADLLPPLLPLLPEEDVKPARPPTAEEERLRALGMKIVQGVVSLRVWDAHGSQLAIGVGCYVSPDGVILTDTGLVHPEIAEKIDYITATGADGGNHRITGFYHADLATGVTLLQSERRETTPAELAPGGRFLDAQPCHVLAVSEKRGLVLADATVQADTSLTGLGWLNVRGQDSPGAVGSPVFDDKGRVIAIVGMKVPLKNWMNFALPCDAAAQHIRQQRAPLQALTTLPRQPRLRQVAQDAAFQRAFQTLQEKRLEPALRQLINLTKKYPRSAECWALLGLTATHLGAADEAVNCQRKAVALDPQSGLYWHQLAFDKLRQSGKTPAHDTEDREALELAVEQRPDDALAWLLLAGRQVRAGDLGSADDSLRRVMLLAPGHAQAWYLSAYVRGRLRDYEGAQTAISRSLKLDPSNAEAWYYQGLLLDRANAPGEAAKAYRNTVRLRPNHPQAWKNLAYSLKKSGRATEARQAFAEHQRRAKEDHSTK